jgi:hypothetical protein
MDNAALAEYAQLVDGGAEFEHPRLAELREHLTRDDLHFLSFAIKRKRKHSRALTAWISHAAKATQGPGTPDLSENERKRRLESRTRGDDPVPPDAGGRNGVSLKRSARERTAYHEAGHIVASIDQGIALYSATIVPAEDCKGLVQPIPRLLPKDLGLLRVFIEKETIILLAGPVAEQWFVGARVGYKSDDVRVEEFVSALLSDPELIDAYLNYVMKRVVQILAHYWDLVDAFAYALMERGTLNQDEIIKVLVDAGWDIPPGWKSDQGEELDAALQAFLAQGETDAARAFVSGWNSARS